MHIFACPLFYFCCNGGVIFLHSLVLLCEVEATYNGMVWIGMQRYRVEHWMVLDGTCSCIKSKCM